MTAILGISAFYHDSAAALCVNGRIVAAAQEERFTRQKHDPSFPIQAVDYCLAEAGLGPGALDFVAFYDKPFLKFERLLETYMAHAPRGIASFMRAMPLWLKRKLYLPREMSRSLGHAYTKRYIYAQHHESHAASAFFPSPFEEAAILTIDGVGEWSTASFGTGKGNRIALTHRLQFPHSLGLLYTAFTYYLGFRVNSGEYKLMGLAPYGEPRYADQILEKIVHVEADGSIHMDMSYFNYCQGLTMTSRRFHDLFGGPPRPPEGRITERHMDIAASIQKVTEEVMLRMSRHVHAVTGQRDLCLAGGVALNCVGNGRILRETPFERIWIQPAAGDAGGSLGVALFVWHQLLGNARTALEGDSQQGSYLGPSFTDDAILSFLASVGAAYHHLPDRDDLCQRVAALIDEQQVVGWFQGRMEFGPRALGARSILGDARSPTMQSTMNQKIKGRESFRPLAPMVTEERAPEYFELEQGQSSPYMLLVAPVREGRRRAEESGVTGLDRLKTLRSDVPAVTHVDYSARVQTVSRERNPLLHRLLTTFEARTGCAVMINTSFNVRGEPIVCVPEDAYRCFRTTGMDALVMGSYLLLAHEQPGIEEAEREAHRARFQAD